MQQNFRKYLSFFLLFLFLFPQVEKGIHDLEHSKDPHCLDKSQQHFHKQEHSCSLCDFMPGVSNEPAEQQQNSIFTSYLVSYLPFSSQVISCEPEYHLPLRAPPLTSC
jgi:hypothetical protein